MKKSIVVFHNASGMIEEMKALFESENLHMIRVSCLEELKILINTKKQPIFSAVYFFVKLCLKM